MHIYVQEICMCSENMRQEINIAAEKSARSVISAA